MQNNTLKQKKQLQEEIAEYKDYISVLKMNKKILSDSKFFRIWQKYDFFRKALNISINSPDKITKFIDVSRRYSLKQAIHVAKQKALTIPDAEKIATNHAILKNVTPESLRMKKILSKGDKTNVVYVIGLTEGESKRYRVFNMIEAINDDSQFNTSTIVYTQLENPIDSNILLNKADIIIFFRVAAFDYVHEFILKAKQRGIITISDFDDFVFDQEVIPLIHEIKDWPADKLAEYKHGVKLYEKTISLCDYFIGSTGFLEKKVEDKQNIPSFTIENFFNFDQISAITETVVIPDDSFTILFMSGTTSHDIDFSYAVEALSKILHENPSIKLKIIGYLNIPDELKRFSNQIIKLGFMSATNLLLEVKKSSLTIVPLELNNFNNGKSNLKFFESALAEVPVIASPAYQYKESIINNKNGWLASSPEEWYAKISYAILNPKKIKTVGIAAKKFAIDTYSPKVMSKKISLTYNEIIKDYKKKLGQPTKKIVNGWVIPAPMAGSGGHNSIFRICRFLSLRGHTNNIYLMDVKKSDLNLYAKRIYSHFGTIGGEIKSIQDLSDDKLDTVIATHWPSVYLIEKSKNPAKRFYFIQDYEPYFYPMGSNYLKAKETYTRGFTHICFSKWVKEKIKNDIGISSYHIDPPIEKSVFYDKKKFRNENTILFLARPNMPRRCFEIGISILNNIKLKSPTTKIVLFGSDLKDILHTIPFDFEDKGIVSPFELADLYNSYDIGLVFSTSNPSMIIYEMGACSLPVVDIKPELSKFTYGSDTNATYIPIADIDKATNLILDLINSSKKKKNQTKSFSKFIHSFPSDKEHGLQFENILRSSEI